MNAHLQRCHAIIIDALHDAGDDARTRRDPGKWSVAEIVEHLTRAYSGTAKGFERCLEKGTVAPSPITVKHCVAQAVLIRLGYFPEGRTAPPAVVPTGELDITALLEAVPRELARLDDAAGQVQQRFGRGKVLDHPIIGALSVEQWLVFHERHTQHHAKQIRLRRQLGYAAVR